MEHWQLLLPAAKAWPRLFVMEMRPVRLPQQGLEPSLPYQPAKSSIDSLLHRHLDRDMRGKDFQVAKFVFATACRINT